MHPVSKYVHAATSRLRHAHKAVFVAGAIAATTAGVVAAAPVMARGANLQYRSGYSVQGSWLCYGWSSGAYHCTQHWHRTSGGQLVSTNTAWVPNYGRATASVSHPSAAKSTPKSTPAKKSVVRTSATVSYAGASNPGQQAVINEIRAVFGPYAGQALAVARCESSYNPYARNSTPIGGAHASGVFQILDTSTWRSTSYAWASPFNASANIHAAYQIFQRDGYSWREWACKP